MITERFSNKKDHKDESYSGNTGRQGGFPVVNMANRADVHVRLVPGVSGEPATFQQQRDH